MNGGHQMNERKRMIKEFSCPCDECARYKISRIDDEVWTPEKLADFILAREKALRDELELCQKVLTEKCVKLKKPLSNIICYEKKPSPRMRGRERSHE